ncbi:MAG TPA: hypothetical protein VFU43_00995 [Streptosporangiaceae bacterium]|nr:hypothetical protein [Streptosporangiaceae bacterium]
MLLSPDDIARRIQYTRRPGWLVWHGRHTRHYWALALWTRGPVGMIGAATPDALEAAIATFELLHPKPTQ